MDNYIALASFIGLFNLILAVHWGLSNEYVSQYLV